MADKTINQLTQATALTDGSLFVIEQNSTAKQANWGMMKNYISPGVAAQYSNSATYNVGDYVIYNDSLYRCNTAITTGEAWTAAHWTAAVLGDDVGKLKNALTPYNAFDIISFIFNPENKTAHQVTFSWSGRTCTVSGTSDGMTACNIIPFKSSLPDGIVAGETYPFIYETTNTNIQLGFIFYNSSDVPTYSYKTESGNITIPSGTVKMSVRLFIEANKNASGTVSNVALLSQTPSADAISALEDYVVGAKAWSINTADALGAVKKNAGDLVRVYSNSSGYGAEYTISKTSLADEILSLKRTLPDGVNILPILSNKDTKSNNGITYSWVDDTTIRMNGTASAESFYNLIISRQQMIPGISPGDDVLVKIGNMAVHASVMVYYYTGGTTTTHVLTYTAFTRLIRIPEDATGLMFRIIVPSGTVISNVDTKIELIVKPQIKHIRALFIGNSYTNDCVNYAPFIAEGLSKNVAFTIGTTYYSGASINDYIDWFDNDTATLTYYKKNGLFPKWNAGVANQTLKQCIADEPWDIIIFQQASSYQGTWSTFSNLNTLINKVLTYRATLHSNAVKIGWMFPQLRYSIISSTTYAKVVECVQNVLNTTPIDFFIPCGTAVQNARGTSLDSIGDSGHLCADGDGHLQAGLPSLIPSYATALKLLELAGEPWHGILQETTRPTATWVTNINSPGENGTSTGVTDANCYLAQKCAVAAMKFPTTVSTVV